jgi:hypothetical protein
MTDRPDVPDRDDPETRDGVALIDALEAPRAGVVPASLFAALDGQVLVCLVAGQPPARSAFPEAAAFEGDAAGHTALAFELSSPAGPEVAALLDRLTAACPPPARVAVALAAGAVNDRGVLGVAPDLAAAVLARQASPGVYLDGALRSVMGRPLPVAGADLRWAVPKTGARRAFFIGVMLAAAVVLVALGPVLLGPTPPHGAVTLLAQHAAANRARGSASPPGVLTLAEGDVVEAVVTAEPGAFVTLLVLDSKDRWTLPLPGPEGVNAQRSPLRQRWELDDQPGTEEILAVVTRTPWNDPASAVAQVNDVPATGRTERYRQLALVLDEAVGPGHYSVARGAEIRHVAR